MSDKAEPVEVQDPVAMAAEYYALQLIKSGSSIADVKDKFYGQFGDDLKLMLFKSLNTAIAHARKDAFKDGKSFKDGIYVESARMLMTYSEEIVEIFK